MIIGRIFAGLVLLIILALVGAVLYLQYAPLSRHQQLIETRVSALLGRELTISGPIELDLFPALSLEVGQLSLANADWGSEPRMASVGRAAARVKLASLISGPLMIESLELEDVDVLLETSADGRSNLDFAGPQAAGEKPAATAEAGAAAAGGLPLMLYQASLANIKLRQRAPEQDDKVVRIEEVSLQGNERAWLTLNGSGTVLEHSLQFNGELGPQEQLAALQSARFNIAGTLGPLQLRGDGEIAELKALQGASATVVISAANVAELLASVDIELPLEGPLELIADIEQTSEGADIALKAGVEKIHAQGQLGFAGDSLDIALAVSSLAEVGAAFDVADLPREALEVKGQVLFATDTIGLQNIVALLGSARLEASGELATGEAQSKLALEASGRSMASLLTTLPEIPFDLSLDLALTPGLLTAQALAVHLGDSDLQGRVTVDLRKDPVIGATLTSRLLDLRPFEQTRAPAEETQAGQAKPATGKGQEQGQQYLFVDEPLPFETLQQIDTDFDLTIDTLISTAAELEQLQLVGTLRDGDLNAAMSFTTPDGGKSSSTIALITAAEQARLEVNIGARGMRINVASGDVDHVEQIPPIDITVELKSAGDTPRKLAAAANGRVIVTQGEGRIENALLERVSGDILAQLFAALNPLANKEKYSQWECSIIAVNIVDGLSTIDSLVLQGEKIMILAGGKIDLNSERLNIEFNTKPRSGIGISADMLVTPFVALSGTLAKPRVGLNETGALLTTGAAFATGGLSLIAHATADRVTAEIDHCKKTLPGYPHPALEAVRK